MHPAMYLSVKPAFQ